VATSPGGRRGPRRSDGRRWELPPRRILLAAGGGLVVLALVIWTVVTHIAGSSGHHSLAAAPGVRTQSTVLVQVQGPLGGAAVDSALIAHDPASHQGAIVLVPSGVISQVPGFGAMPFGKASTLGQRDAPRTTLADLMGVTIDGSWTLSTKALQGLVDKVGGVDVDVDADVTKPGPKGSTTIVVPVGRHQLGGAAAAAYATFLGDSEPEQTRLARFDAVFRAVLGKLPKQPGAVAPLVSSLGSGSSSSLAVTRLADVLVGLAADNAKNAMVDTVLPVTRIDAGSDLEAFSLDTAGTAAFVKAHLAQSVPPNQKVTGNRVMVENQVGTPGIGETTRTRLLKAGFTYVPGANAPGMPNPTAPSVVLITGKTSADIAKGNAVAAALGLPTSDVRVSSQHVQVADVIVLLGADYKP
jgi:anionic cell wall polymer biosynthesis LytR-Cps2A-Psr (LCP) family protein